MRFSIIIPTFNRAQILPDTLMSILSQTFTDFEILVVDDGSTDDTRQVIEALADPRINYFHKVNEERNIARNFGTNLASAEYVTFFDSDDIMLPTHLELSNKELTRLHDPEVFLAGFLTQGSAEPASNGELQEITINQALLKENVAATSAVFLRQDVAKEFQFLRSTDAVLGEDYYLWLRLAARFDFHYSHQVTVLIQEHDSRSIYNIDLDKLRKGNEQIIEALKSDTEVMAVFGSKALKVFATMYALTFLYHAKNNKIIALKAALQALREDWLVLMSKRFLAATKHLIFSW